MIARFFLTFTMFTSLPALGMDPTSPTPLHQDSSGQGSAHPERAQRVEGRRDTNALNQQLLAAARLSSQSELQKILAHPDVDVRTTDTNGNTALHLLGMSLFGIWPYDIITTLVQRGALIDARNSKQQTPLHCTVQQDAWSLMQYMVKHHQANVNAQDADGNTPLHLAAACCWQDTFFYKLIKLGANVNIQNIAGNTPLHALFSAPAPMEHTYLWEEQESKIAHLLKAGARIDIKNAQGATPCDHNHEAVLNRIYIPLINAICHGYSTSIQQLLAQGADVNFNIQDERKLSRLPFLLNMAICSRDPKIIRLLLDAGANPTLRSIKTMPTDDTQPVLHDSIVTHALKRGGPEMAELLLTHVSKRRIRETWNSCALPFLLICKRLPYINNDISRILCSYYIKATLLEDQRTLAQAVCSQVEFKDPIITPEELKGTFDPAKVSQYYPVWEQQIHHALQSKSNKQ